MKKVGLFYTDKGYSYIKCTKEDCLNWGGLAICDDCNKTMEDEIYLIYVLGLALCKDCFENWLKRSVRYEEDLYNQSQNHIKFYKRYGFEVFEENEMVAFVGTTPDREVYSVEIGRIKKLCDNGAFVYYHTGDTAAKTDYKDLYKIKNKYAIKNLGGKEIDI